MMRWKFAGGCLLCMAAVVMAAASTSVPSLADVQALAAKGQAKEALKQIALIETALQDPSCKVSAYDLAMLKGEQLLVIQDNAAAEIAYQSAAQATKKVLSRSKATALALLAHQAKGSRVTLSPAGSGGTAATQPASAALDLLVPDQRTQALEQLLTLRLASTTAMSKELAKLTKTTDLAPALKSYLTPQLETMALEIAAHQNATTSGQLLASINAHVVQVLDQQLDTIDKTVEELDRRAHKKKTIATRNHKNVTRHEVSQGLDASESRRLENDLAACQLMKGFNSFFASSALSVPTPIDSPAIPCTQAKLDALETRANTQAKKIEALIKQFP